jgi:hypothetical protein
MNSKTDALIYAPQMAAKPDYDVVRKAITDLLESDSSGDFDDGRTLQALSSALLGLYMDIASAQVLPNNKTLHCPS